MSRIGSKEYREKMRQIALSHGFGKWMIGKKDSNATKKKKSKLMKGENNPFFGKKHSKKSKEKMSESLKGKIPWIAGRKHTYESRKKIKAKRLIQTPIIRIPLDEDQKKRISIGTKNGMKDPSVRAKLSKSITKYFKDNPKAKEHLREIRLKQKMPHISSIEKKMCGILDILCIKYVPQYPIKGKDFLTFVDIYIPSKNLCIYCDGDYWHNLSDHKIRDVKVNIVLTTMGYKIIRLWEHEINEDTDKCIERIKRHF